ncbi:hypothetical protein I4U23_010145 [Adineta vaga]|nr:hypothetical protein I4U23_010145 [Adineta vaga]
MFSPNYLCSILLLLVIHIQHLHSVFTPNTKDYDAYGSKITLNDHLLVLAQNSYLPPTFAIQFAPYNSTLTSSQCSLIYPNTTNTFIYSVVLGKKQNQTQLHFFFIGEHTNDQNGIFIGMATFNHSQQTSNLNSSICNASFTYSLHYLNTYSHQEYSILGVHPQGIRAYVFTNRYVAVFHAVNTSSTNLNTWDGQTTWPDESFIPHAVDLSDHFGVIAGFIQNNANATVKYSPMIYLIRFNSSDEHYRPYVAHEYQPIATPGTWQDLLTNADADVYSAKYDMSVSIDEKGNVFVGMQFINRVFLFTVNITNPIELNFVSRFTNGRSIGNGKGVAWMENGIGAVLINVYTLDYVWSSSQVYLFDIHENGYNSNSTPLSIFPNSHQLLPSSFSSIFLNIVSSPSSLALLDDKGNVLIFTPTQSQYYPAVITTGSSPFITSAKSCMAGTFKNKSGIHDCVLCRTGTKNPGNASDACIPCSSDAFCPLGSVADVSKSTLETVYQVVPYPHSPESTIFDEILIQTMFSIGSGRCLFVSPLFWALIVASIVIVIIIIMEIMHLFIKHPQSRKIRKVLQAIFRHMDLISDGEYWISGLVSFSVVVLVGFSYAFSNEYLRQYPIEKPSDAYFTCDKSMRNAKFDTNVQSLAIPLTHDEQEMFDLLNEQEFTLNVDFINTLVNCDAVSIQAQFGLTWSTIRWSDCNNINATLTLSVPLPYQHISVKVFLEDTKVMGAIRIGFSAHGRNEEKYSLLSLDFSQSFWKNEYVLSREESDFGGIYIPTFTVDMNSLFVSNDQYVRSSATITTLAIVISETPYYVKNVQQPIARKSEVIFRNLLFTVVCLEIFGLIFLSYKLLFKPLYVGIIRNRLKRKTMKHDNEEPVRSYY